MENRRFERMRFTARGDLRHQGITYQVRLENISRGGVLISSDDCIMVTPGETCSLSIKLEKEDRVLRATVEVVHSFFSMVGVKFLSFQDGGEEHLVALLHSLQDSQSRLDD